MRGNFLYLLPRYIGILLSMVRSTLSQVKPPSISARSESGVYQDAVSTLVRTFGVVVRYESCG